MVVDGVRDVNLNMCCGATRDKRRGRWKKDGEPGTGQVDDGEKLVGVGRSVAAFVKHTGHAEP